MSDLDAREQLSLELANRARMDPLGEAARFGLADLNSGLAAGTISSAPKQVLAPSSILETSAQNHANYLMSSNLFTHTGSGGTTSNQRMANAGYATAGTFWSAENIAWSGSTGVYDANAQVYAQHQQWMLSAGHRRSMLNPVYEELGVGHATTSTGYQGMTNAMVMVQNYGALNTLDKFVTGVSYTDSDSDDFYSIGEGQGGRTVQLFQSGSVVATATTAAAGGYSLKTTATGAVEVVFSGGGLSGNNGVNVTLGSTNIKVDMVDNNTIETNVTATLTQSAQNMRLIGIDNIDGTGNGLNNTIWGNKGNNTLDGGNGNDTLNGGDGTDVLIGGNGNDALNGGNGTDTAQFAGNMSAYTITYNAGSATYTFYGADGSMDTATGIENFQFADGTRSAAQLTVSGSPPVRTASISAQTPTANEGNAGTTAFTFTVTLNAASYATQTINYTVAGSGVNGANASDFSGVLSGTVTFAAGETSKTVTVLVAGDTVLEQDETFTVTLSAPSAGLSVGTSSATSTILNDEASINVINGTVGNDVQVGTSSADQINGLDGNDRMNAGTGNDMLFGGIGDDSMYGEDNDDVLIGGAGMDYMDGGAGTDFVSYEYASAGVRADLVYRSQNTGDVVGDTFVNIEGLRGSAHNDILYSTEVADIVEGGDGQDLMWTRGGNDRLFGQGGNDSMYGREDDDLMVGGAGMDYMDGGDGFDTVSYEDSASGVVVDLVYRSGNTGDAVGDSFVNIEALTGSNFGDTLTGTTGNDTISGLAGADYINARSGNDTLFGGAGNDQIYAGDGDDYLEGGANSDYLDGGTGADTFRFSDIAFGTDTIAGFEDGVDKLSFSLSVADNFSDFTITGNGTSIVTVAISGQSITIYNGSALTLAADDFLFIN